MVKKTRYIRLLLCALFQPHLLAISVVYNFRIAQITKQAIFESEQQKKRGLVALLFDIYQKKRNTGPVQNFIGLLGSFLYNHKSYYGRIDTAVSHIRETACYGVDFTDTETDDILFTFGKSFKPDSRAVVNVGGLFGIPTHKILRLRHVDFGYSQVGLGVQCDGTYALTKQGSCIYGGRYIHFFPRNARNILGDAYNFSIGNIGDLLFAYKVSGERHGFESGYTSRWQFGAHVCPNISDLIEKTNYARNNFYFVYKYKFHTKMFNNRLLYYIAYGYDRSPKRFGNKFVITLWTSWNGRF